MIDEGMTNLEMTKHEEYCYLSIGALACRKLRVNDIKMLVDGTALNAANPLKRNGQCCENRDNANVTRQR